MRRDAVRSLIRRGAGVAVLTLALVSPLTSAGGATAEPLAVPSNIDSVTAAAKPSANGSRLDHVVEAAGGSLDAYVYSASMGRNIQLKVIRPNDTSAPRPTLYLLNGAAGGEEPPGDWLEHTDVVQFVADKKVNVVIPIGGKQSYYTDWLRPDPVLGRNMWTTFLTKELPPVINSMLGTTGRNAIAGLSMSGTSVLALAESAPGLYRSVSSYSGCASTSDPQGELYVKAVVEARGRGNTLNMWGPTGGPDWIANDPLINAERLRGTQLYISAGNGLLGPHDNLGGGLIGGDPAALALQSTVGAALEVVVNQCTRMLQTRLNQLGIPATFNFHNGTHSWDYWQDDLHISWPIIAQSLGV